MVCMGRRCVGPAGAAPWPVMVYARVLLRARVCLSGGLRRPLMCALLAPCSDACFLVWMIVCACAVLSTRAAHHLGAMVGMSSRRVTQRDIDTAMATMRLVAKERDGEEGDRVAWCPWRCVGAAVLAVCVLLAICLSCAVAWHGAACCLVSHAQSAPQRY